MKYKFPILVSCLLVSALAHAEPAAPSASSASSASSSHAVSSPPPAPASADAGQTDAAQANPAQADVTQYGPTGPASHRQRLEPRDRAECLSLEHKIAELQQAERKAKYLKLRQIQQELSTRQARYFELGC